MEMMIYRDQISGLFCQKPIEESIEEVEPVKEVKVPIPVKPVPKVNK